MAARICENARVAAWGTTASHDDMDKRQNAVAAIRAMQPEQPCTHDWATKEPAKEFPGQLWMRCAKCGEPGMKFAQQPAKKGGA
jgi:formylmethanofuran dehydrogenase subunit E